MTIHRFTGAIAAVLVAITVGAAVGLLSIGSVIAVTPVAVTPFERVVPESNCVVGVLVDEAWPGKFRDRCAAFA